MQPSEDTKIWRYIQAKNINSLLEQRNLFFAKAASLNDVFEGSYPKAFEKDFGAVFNLAQFNLARFDMPANYFPEKIKDEVFICCFTINDTESDLLWKAYQNNGEGIAIQSTLSCLKSCFDGSEGKEIFIGKIKYIDPTETFPGYNPIINFLHKRKEFEKENELRAITMKFLECREKIDQGVYIPINIHEMIKKIVISPHASPDFEEIIRSMCAKQQLGEIVFRSTLEDKPLW